MSDHINALEKAKIQLLCRPDSVFITTVVFNLKFIWDDTIPTACTNGLVLKINPSFFNNLPEPQRIFVLAHEAYHIVFQHMLRVGGRNFRVWNIACDYVINLMLQDSNFQLWPNCLVDERYRGMSAPEVYDKLVKEKPEDLPDSPDDFEAVDGTPADIANAEQEIQATILKAAIQAKASDQAGSIPGEINDFINKLLNPVLPWQAILSNQLTQIAKNDYSYARPNRRYLPDLYMPSMYSESLGDIAVAVDTSGSVSQDQFNAFITEIDAINKRLLPDKIDVIGFDTRIQGHHVIEEFTDITKLNFSGRGGTDIQPVYEWANKNKPRALIIFTDGYFPLLQDQIPRKIPIFWIIHSNNKHFKVNRGKVIHYQE